MNGWVFGLATAWVVGAVALCALLAAGNRRSRLQSQHAARALAARRAGRHSRPHSPAWARTDRHGDHR